ncbi:MAG: ABC transporter ATP-binding protein, partial [Pirellulales bacterium]
MAEIELEYLTKAFRAGVTAVDRLQLHVAAGELVVLVGPSGCGKTTTLRMIAGLERPTSGEVKIGGRDVTQLAPRKRNLAMVFQDAALMPHLDVQRNLAFGLLLGNVSKPEVARRVNDVSSLLDLRELLARRPHELSGGQRCRVALGRALVHDADCLLLDEPLSYLDAEARRQLRERIREVHRQTGRTMIYVTHDQEEAMALGQRIAVLRDGVLQQFAAPDDVYHRPANRFVASFIGGAAMNFVAGNLRCDEREVTFECDGFKWPIPKTLRAQMPEEIHGPVALGFRPESIRLLPSGQHGTGNFGVVVKIHASQLLGDRVDVHLTASWCKSLRARVAGAEVFAVGDQVELVLDADDLYFFAANESGGNLLNG